MLEMRDISASYGDMPALRDVTAAFEPGRVLVIVGPNGSGKSTLLKTAIGLHPHTSGEILLDGRSASELTPKQVAQRVSYLPQFRNVPDITAWRMVLHGRFPHMGYPRRVRRADEQIAMEALEAADAAGLAGRSVKELSGGQRQKVYIAMALAQQTDTILMDEPTTYLDAAHQLQVTALAGKLAAQGKAVALVLHDLPLAFRCADRLLVLREGGVVCAGTPDEVYDVGAVDDVFGVAFRRAETADGPQYFCLQR